jgi:hypothetical protein
MVPGKGLEEELKMGSESSFLGSHGLDLMGRTSLSSLPRFRNSENSSRTSARRSTAGE